MALAQAHIDAINSKAEEDLTALRDAAASAKERVESGVSELKSVVEPDEELATADPSLPPDMRPTIEVDLPDEMSFNDFDPGAPSAPEPSAPVVRFDPEVDSAVDDDGIPIWDDPV
ncbi:MAG: hypothetical protein M3N19_07550 [Candidatus Eremiobacteraeota bacterium]|nr:hypothetical protein [Candidatus Eremiobacteraeota bacterium]